MLRRRQGGKSTADARLVAGSDLFDAAYYSARHNPDRHKTFDPVAHFLTFGARQGLSPSPRFISAAYLVMNPDVAHSRVNPLVHYLRTGREEGRRAYGRDDLPEIGLDHTTPRERMWLSILASSGLFDADHYVGANPEAAGSGQHPMLHFLRNAKGRPIDPGPSFDAAAYMSQHPAIADKGHVAVIHALNRNAGRAPGQVEREARPQARPSARERLNAAYRLLGPVYTATLRRDFKAARALSRQAAALLGGAAEVDYDAPLPEDQSAALISLSRLFDAEWYAAEYPDVGRSGLTPALHYVRVGAGENRRPSKAFDPEHYAAHGLPPHVRNPLEHYLRTGRAQGVRPTALLDFLPAVRKPLLASGADATIFAPTRETAASPIGWVRLDADHADAAAAIDGPDKIGCLRAYRRLVAFDPAAASYGHDGAPERLLPEALASGPARLADAWFADEGTLRLRFGDAGTGEAAAVVRLLQAPPEDPGSPALVAESLIGTGGPILVDARLADPLAPILVALCALGGETLDYGLIPFPSLLRGGLHHAEAAAVATSNDLFADLQRYAAERLRERLSGAPAISRVAVRRAGATGAEAIFQAPMVAWLARGFGVRLTLDRAEPGDAAAAWLERTLQSGVAPRPGATLTIPPDALPSLAALTAPALDEGGPSACGFAVADLASGAPRLAVDMPAAGHDLIDLQPPAAGPCFPTLDATPDALGAPAAVIRRRFAKRHEAQLLAPLAPDAPMRPCAAPPADGEVLALVFASRPRAASRALMGLASQTAAARLRAIVLVDPDAAGALEEIAAAAADILPGRGTARLAERDRACEIARAAVEEPAAFLLATHDGALAHDPRTLETLLSLARDPGVDSAACVALKEAPFKKGTTFLFHSGGFFAEPDGDGGARLAPADTLAAFPDAVYPVAANAFDFALLRRDAAAKAFAATSDADDPPAEMRLALGGGRHLCASSVTVTVSAETPDPVATAAPAGFAPGGARIREIG